MCEMFFTNYKWLDHQFDLSQLVSSVSDSDFSQTEAKTVAELKQYIKKVLEQKYNGRMQVQLHETIQILLIHQELSILVGKE